MGFQLFMTGAILALPLIIPMLWSNRENPATWIMAVCLVLPAIGFILMFIGALVGIWS